MKSLFVSILLGIHLGCVFLFNLSGIMQSYGLLHSLHTHSTLNQIQSLLQQCLSKPYIRYYGDCSGASTLYGFFAPRVGSQYLTRFTLYNANQQAIAHLTVPLLHSQEGIMRYARLLDVFEPLVKQPTDTTSFDQRYAKAIFHNLLVSVGRQYPEAKSISGCIYLCAISTRLAFSHPSAIRLVPIYQHQLSVR